MVKPESVSVVSGSRTEIKCQATGVPKPIITWKRESGELMEIAMS